MSHTVESLLKQFPDAQLVADIVLLYRDGKHIELGKRADGAFNLTAEGKIFLQNAEDSPKQEKAKPAAKKAEKSVEQVDLAVE